MCLGTDRLVQDITDFTQHRFTPKELAQEVLLEVTKDAREKLVSKISRKMVKFTKVALKIGKNAFPVTRVLGAAYKLAKVVYWFMAEGSDYFTAIRDAWRNSPRKYDVVGINTGRLFGAAIVAFDKDGDFKKKLTGARSRRDLELTWEPLRYDNQSHADAAVTYKTINSIEYHYESTFTTKVLGDNETTHSLNSVQLNCTLRLIPIER